MKDFYLFITYALLLVTKVSTMLLKSPFLPPKMLHIW